MVRLLLPFVVCLVSVWAVYLVVVYKGRTLSLVVEEERETTWADPVEGRDAQSRHSETHNLESVSSGDQFEEVKNRTFKSEEKLSRKLDDLEERHRFVSQGEIDVMMAWMQYMRSSGSERAKALEEIRGMLSERARVDAQFFMVGVLLFGSEDAPAILYAQREAGQKMVEDLDCFISRGRFFERHCGLLDQYGLRRSLALANICNRLVAEEAYQGAVLDTCGKKVVTFESSF